VDGVLARFGEVGIKSPPVRRQMLGRLQQNMFEDIQRLGIEAKISLIHSRVWLQGKDVDALLEIATKTFGVVSASPCKLITAEMDEMSAEAIKVAMAHDWDTFAIQARREGTHEYSSREVGMTVGGAVFNAAKAAGRNPKVDLTNPDFAVSLDIRDNRCYMHTESVGGPGGLPLGSQGRVICLISDRNSFISAWLMMRRGCRVILVHAGDTGSIPDMDAIQSWGSPTDVDLLPICTGFVDKTTLLEATWQLGKRLRADALVLGDDIESDLAVIPGVPILRPVCGLAKSEVEALAAQIGLEDEEHEHIFAESKETVDSVLSMHRVVSC
jgi:thiamine biosynthesis protein ThiI